MTCEKNVSRSPTRRAAIRWYRVTNIMASAGVPFGSYLIFYRVGTETIEVVHILHGARDYDPLLFPEG
jgi:plasmid stabilization system protein ParE